MNLTISQQIISALIVVAALVIILLAINSKAEEHKHNQ